MARTLKRSSGCTSCTITPSLVATRISRTSSAKEASALTISFAWACAAALARSSSARLSTPGTSMEIAGSS